MIEPLSEPRDATPGTRPPKDEPVPPGQPPRDEAADRAAGGGNRGVALLLAVAAVLAAIIASRAAFFANDASGAWQSALRTELKRAALATLDIDYVFETEAELAFLIESLRVRAQEARSEGERQGGEAAAALIAEAQVRDGMVEQMASASEIVGDPAYALPEGGFDLGARLADRRATNPEDLELDPDAAQQQGDEAASRSLRLMMVALPVGLCFLVGALAVPLRRGRRPLLVTGWLLVVLAMLLAIGVEAGA